MKSIKWMSVVMAVLLFSATANAQQTGITTMKLNYSVAMPMGSFKDFISNNSYRGVNGEIMYHFNNKFSLGFGTGYQDYYQRYPRSLYKLNDGSDISAVVTNSVQTIPLLLKAQYNFSPGTMIQPYVALGAGGNIISYRQYLGEFPDSKTGFGFAATPEAGVFIPFRKYGPAGFNLGVAYNFMPFNYGEVKNLNGVAVNAGVSFPIH